jgi:hypothetical protein
MNLTDVLAIERFEGNGIARRGAKGERVADS